jgi:hypothetical protein
MKYWLIAVSFFGALSGISQSYRLQITDPVICLDYKKNQVVVIEDSSYMLQISLDTKNKTKRRLYIDPQVRFEDLRLRYQPVSEPGSNIFFVDHGCGWLLELRNDSIIRIDESFHHQNQFNGAYFIHNGKPHVFGGYGLFTTKSIITRFDFNLGQWYLLEEKQPLFCFVGSIYHKSKDHLYVVNSLVGANWNKHNQVYTYDLKRNVWRFLNSFKFLDTLGKSIYPLINGNLLIYGDKLFEFDFQKGQIEKYQLKTDNWCRKVFKMDGFYLLFGSSTNYNRQTAFGWLQIFNEKEFNNKFHVESIPMYEEHTIAFNQPKNLWIIVAAIFVVLVILYWRHKKRRNPKVNKVQGTSKQVEDVLRFWLSKPEYLLELSEINDFVNYDEPSPDTLKKRRETLLRQFSSELAQEYGFLEDNIYTTQSHPKDKRMKLLVLNSMLVNKVKKENSSKFI